MLCGNNKLAKTSSTPGKTKLVNHFLINQEWYLVDLPGYGYAKMFLKDKEKLAAVIRDYLNHSEEMIMIFVLIDSRHDMQEIDLNFLTELGENGIPVPSELDYDFWLGPAPYKPYNAHRVHQTFRGYWDYDGGGLGDMGQHYIDPVQYFLMKDDTSPVKVEVDAPQQHHDAVGTWRSITYTYEDGCQIVLWGGNYGNPDTPYIAGPNGNVYKNFVCDIPNWEKKLADYPEPAPQQTDFIECVKTRQPFALNERNGFRSSTIVNLGAVALRLNRTLHFDPVKLEFINDEEANRLLDQPMRAPWNI